MYPVLNASHSLFVTRTWLTPSVPPSPMASLISILPCALLAPPKSLECSMLFLAGNLSRVSDVFVSVKVWHILCVCARVCVCVCHISYISLYIIIYSYILNLSCRGEVQSRWEKKFPAQFVLAMNYERFRRNCHWEGIAKTDLIHRCLSRINVIIICVNVLCAQPFFDLRDQVD